MKTETTTVLAVACMAVSAFAGTELAPIDASAERNPSPLRVDMKRIGTLRPRGTDEIKGSPWMIDSACLDRDFADFDEYKDYIVPLGIKEMRIPAKRQIVHSAGVSLVRIPAYDSPCLVTERAALDMMN